MPCIFLNNLSDSFLDELETPRLFITGISPSAKLYKKISDAAGCEISKVEIHLSTERYKLLSPHGKTRPCLNIHGTVEWFASENRDVKAKQAIADAIQQFLNSHLAGEGFDLTFRDSPAETFFVEKNGKSVLVEGGEFIPPNKVLAQVAYEVLGHETPGVITSD